MGATGGLDSGLFQQAPLFVAVAIGQPLVELQPRTVMTYSPLAVTAASLQIGVGGTCDAGNRGTMHAENGTVRLCDGNQWIHLISALENDGTRPETAASSCASIHQRYPASPTGTYILKSGDGTVYPALCEMDHRGGGWTLVLKANNGDAVNFYSNHLILDGDATLNEDSERDLSRGDYIGSSYTRVVGNQMLLRDCEGNNDLMGSFDSTGTLRDVIVQSHSRELDPHWNRIHQSAPRTPGTCA